MSEGKPPLAEIHPMRCLFMIPIKPAPTFQNAAQFSPQFNDFLLKCLNKQPSSRATASDLLKHEFILNADIDLSRTNLLKLINDSVQERNTIQQKYSNELNKTAIYTFNTSSSIASSSLNDNTIDSFQTLIDRSVKNKLVLKESDEFDNNITLKSNNNNDPNYFTTNFNGISQATMLINEEHEVDNEIIETQSGNSIDLKQIQELISKETKQYEKEHCLGLSLTKTEIEMRLKLMYTQMEIELDNLRLQYDKKREVLLNAIEIKKNSSQFF